MLSNKMLKLFLTVFFFSIFGYLYFRYFEVKSIYFPTKQIEFYPKDIDLDYEEISFNTKDNVSLNGWFIPGKRPRATLIFCHGNAGNISNRLEFIRLFNSINLNIFIFDYRGYGKSKGSPNEKGTYLDVRAAYEYVCSRDDVDKNKVIVYGESLGGAVAIDLAKDQEDLMALITFGSFSSTKDMAKAVYPFLPIWFMVSMKYDNISKVKDIKIPKLIAHGANDEIVPFKQGEALFKEAANPKEFLVLRGGHNDAILIEQGEFLKKVDEFLTKYGD